MPLLSCFAAPLKYNMPSEIFHLEQSAYQQEPGSAIHSSPSRSPHKNTRTMEQRVIEACTAPRICELRAGSIPCLTALFEAKGHAQVLYPGTPCPTGAQKPVSLDCPARCRRSVAYGLFKRRQARTGIHIVALHPQVYHVGARSFLFQQVA